MYFSPCLLSTSSFLELSSVFQLDEQKPRYLNLKILGWKLKGQSGSTQKSQNGFFPISSSYLIELIAIDGIEFEYSFYELFKIHQLLVWGEGTSHKKIAWKLQVMKSFWKLE